MAKLAVSNEINKVYLLTLPDFHYPHLTTSGIKRNTKVGKEAFLKALKLTLRNPPNKDAELDK